MIVLFYHRLVAGKFRDRELSWKNRKDNSIRPKFIVGSILLGADPLSLTVVPCKRARNCGTRFPWQCFQRATAVAYRRIYLASQFLASLIRAQEWPRLCWSLKCPYPLTQTGESFQYVWRTDCVASVVCETTVEPMRCFHPSSLSSHGVSVTRSDTLHITYYQCQTLLVNHISSRSWRTRINLIMETNSAKPRLFLPGWVVGRPASDETKRMELAHGLSCPRLMAPCAWRR